MPTQPEDALRSVTCLYQAELIARNLFPASAGDDDDVTLPRKNLVTLMATCINNGWQYRDKGEGAALFDSTREWCATMVASIGKKVKS